MKAMNLTQILDEKEELEKELAQSLKILEVANDTTERTLLALEIALKQFNGVCCSTGEVLANILKAKGDRALISNLIKTFMGDMEMQRKELDNIELGAKG